jgi:hypothetical protein
MSPRTKQIVTVIVVVILVLLAIEFIRDREGAKRGFRQGYDSTAGSPVR